MRTLLKRFAERAIVRSGLATRQRRKHGGATLILAYHNVVPDEDAQLQPDALHLPYSHFLRQLDALEEMAEVVALEDIAISSSRGVPRVVLTFDDAYAGAVKLAFPELARRALPATTFVCPGLLQAESFWWDAFDSRGHDEEVFQTLAADHRPVHDFLASRGAPRKNPSDWRRPAGIELLRPYLAASDGSIRIGGHTWTHPNLAALSDSDVRWQLRQTREWLLEEAEHPSGWLACPYGFNSPAVARYAADLGYVGALEISGGWVPPGGGDRFATPRVNVPSGLSEDGFLLRISGVIRR